MEIVAGDDATHFFLTNVKDGDKLKVDTAFNGSNSGYSVTIINDGNEEFVTMRFTTWDRLPQQKQKLKRELKLMFMLDACIKQKLKSIDKVVKLDSSVNPSTWTGSCTSYTFEFTVGDQK